MTDTASRRAGAPETIHRVVVRFAGDSGDGMQITGDRFTSVSAAFGNDLSTMPDYPAEIRAPAGTIHGVSSFQVHISDHDITTPGDAPSVLIAMNPAALRADLGRLERNGLVILNSDTFDERSLAKAGYAFDPRDDGSLTGYRVIEVPMTSLTLKATETLGVKPRDAERSKNFFALGLISWLYSRPVETTIAWIDERFAKVPLVAASNKAAFVAGVNFGETAEVFDHPYQVESARLTPGEYTNITGNTALAWGIVAAGQLAHLPIMLGSYPITPASDILHELSKHKNFGVRTFQAEDEIAAAGSALGAAFAGHLGVTTTSGPGVALKSETISLAISLELPMLIVDIQRGGPSTGLPTKTEAADLDLVVYGRHAEAPLPVVAAYSPAQCFDAAIEAVRLALKYRTPVVLLSDGYLANGAEPWRLPDVASLPDIGVAFASEPNHVRDDGTAEFWPYLRDPDTLARPWAIPGTPGLQHRVGGLEKEDGSGNISYTPHNHDHMVRIRAEKIARIANDIPPVEVFGDPNAQLLVLGWGSTWGAIRDAVQRCRAAGLDVAHAHLTHVFPLPANLGTVLGNHRQILVPELNLGQLTRMIRAEYLVDARAVTKVEGLPFTAAELVVAIEGALAGAGSAP